MEQTTVRRRLRFYGKVQGIGFRSFCNEAAQPRAIRGWVRNCPDGSVELEAEGPEAAVEEYLRHLRTGHPWARVDRVESMPLSPSNDEGEGFEITY